MSDFRRRCLVAWLAALILASAAAARDGHLAELDGARRQLERASPGDLEAAVERVLSLRAEVIAAHPDDRRRAGWLADQASDLYFGLGRVEASLATALLGAPDDRQLDRARRVAREMNSAARGAEIAADEIVLELESDPAFAADPALREEHRALIADRDRRIAFLRGVAAALAAELSAGGDAERRRLARIATGALDPLAGALGGALDTRARLYSALAHARLGEDEAAMARLDEVAGDGAAPPLERAVAGLARARLSADRDGPAAGLEALGAVAMPAGNPARGLAGVLAADVRFELLVRLAEAGPAARRADLLADAYGAYLALLDEDLDLDERTRRALVMDRLRRLSRDAPLEVLPPIVTVARAEALAATAAGRDEAIGLLEGLLVQRGVPAPVRAEAIMQLARALLAQRRIDESAGRLDQLLAELPESAPAPAAAALAAEIHGALTESRPADRAARARARQSLARMLEALPDHPRADDWRCQAAELAIAGADHEAAIELYEQVDPDAHRGVDAVLGRARAAFALAESEARPESRQKLLRSLIDDIAVARRRIVAAATRGDADAADAGDRLTVIEAHALVALGRARDGLDLLERAGVDQGHPAYPQAVAARIDAHARLGDHDAAARELTGWLASADRDAGAVLESMLERRRVEIDRLEAQERQAEAADARATLLLVAGALQSWLDDQPDGARPRRLVVAAADAFRNAGAVERARPLYDEVLAAQPGHLTALIGRAECLFVSGTETETAMAIYRRVAETLSPRDGDPYWLAQLRMLQILDRTGRHLDAIAPQVRRLREKDPELGGERYRHAFDALERKHS